MTDPGPYLSPAPSGPVVLVTSVGAAAGSRAAAAALACAASDSDRAALSIELGGDRRPRPSLLATAAARSLEERLVAHLPEAGIASRGAICRLSITADPSGLDDLVAALPIVRDWVAAIHLPPHLLRPALGEPRIRATAALLCADLAIDRSLTALVAGDLVREGLRVAVLQRPLGWVASRAALLGGLPRGAGLRTRLIDRLLSEPPG